MVEDISKKTVGILLLLVIIISVIGTWVVFDKTQEISKPIVQSKTEAYVKLTILPADEESQVEEKPKPVTTTGYVALTIL